MKIKKLITVLLTVSVCASLFGQTQQLSGYKSFSSRSITPIFSGKEIKGYTLFARGDKADKKNYNYHLAVYDENLSPVKKIEIVKTKELMLLSNVFNGTEMALYFYNFKDDRFEIEAYDLTLNKIASLNVDRKLNKTEQMILQQQKAQKEDADGGGSMTLDISLRPVPGKGFIANSIQKNGSGYSLEMFDNSLKSKWKYQTPEDFDGYEGISIDQISEKYLLGIVGTRPGMMSKKITYYLVVFNVDDGKKVFQIPVEGSLSEQLSMNTLTYDEASNQIITIGEFYKLDDKPGVSKSQGFYVKAFSETGKENNKKFYSWEKDVKSLLPAEAKASLDKGAMNYTHKVIKAKDGKIYLICEQFSKAADGLGIAANVLNGGGSSNVKAVVWNMIIYVLNPDFTMKEVKFYPKDKSNVILPAGSGMMGSGLIGSIVKMVGGFDYQFSQVTNDGKGFASVYIDYDKEKGEDTKRMLGSIIISPEGQFNLDKMDITTKASSSFLYPGKPGYLMMVDYLRKEKTVGMKLIKLNY